MSKFIKNTRVVSFPVPSSFELGIEGLISFHVFLDGVSHDEDGNPIVGVRIQSIHNDEDFVVSEEGVIPGSDREREITVQETFSEEVDLDGD